MLSTSIIGNAADAARYYFSQDNYYFKDSQTAQENSQWWGKGAAEWGLEGKVDPQHFKDLLRGHLPDGQKLGTVKEGKMQHRPGFDLTFSAPKSVSLLGLMTADKPTRSAIEQAMLKAAKNTLGMIEEACSGARITQKGRTTFVKTHNLTVALFLHDLSREDDPQLHVHAVVMNMTKRPDGAWRSLASQIGDYGKNATRTLEGFFEQVRHDKLFYGTLFRAELAVILTEMGFHLVVDEAKGLFEIEGVSKAARDAYSTRAQQIQQHLQEHQLLGAAAASVAALKTRQSKKTIDRDTLQTLWEEKGQTAEVDAFKEVDDLVNTLKREKTTPRPEPSVSLLAKQALAYAIALHSENQNTLSTLPLIQAAAQYAMGKVKLADLLNALEQLKIDGELIALDPAKDDGYTTPQLLGHEKKILQAIAHPINPPEKLTPLILNAFLSAQRELNRDQKAALCLLFSDPQRIQGIEGQSGTGKTTLIKPLFELAQLLGMDSIVLTPSQSACVGLEKALRQASRSLKEWFKTLFANQHYASVAEFIQQARGSTYYFSRQKIIVVDQAPLLSAKQMAGLITIAEKSKAFLILLGDKQGLSTWQSSNPFQLLIDHGMKTATLKRVVAKSSLHKAIQDTLAGHLNQAFARIDQRLITIDDKNARLQAMATQFAALSPLAQSTAWLLMPTRAACNEANLAVREALKNTQQLGTSATVVQALIPQLFKQTGSILAENYTVGQWLRYKSQYLKIVDRFLPSNTLLLQNIRGKTRLCPLHKIRGRNHKASPLEVFVEAPRELTPGDVLIWKRSDRAQGLSSGDRLTVVSCASHRLVLLRSNQKRLSLDLRDFKNRHFDYGYAITPFTAVSIKPHTVIAYQKASSRLSHQRAFYSLLNMARGEVWLYTENKAALLHSVARYTGTTLPLLDHSLDTQ